MNTHKALYPNRRKGFTLVELVVVILVMGIVAAVAAPKMFDTANDARESSTKHSLTVVRNAIELYRTNTGKYPGEAGETDLKSDLVPYLQGPFPVSHMNGNDNTGSVTVTHTGDPLSYGGTTDWKYDSESGQFIANHDNLDEL